MADIRQRAEGSNINQAGRDINVVLPQPVTTENLIACPDCKRPVSRNAVSCPACGFPVERHFLGIVERKRQQRNERLILVCFTIVVICSTGMFYFTLPESELRGYVPLIGAGMLVFAFAYRRLVRKLAEWGLL